MLFTSCYNIKVLWQKGGFIITVKDMEVSHKPKTLMRELN